jgi:hypothetical protein
LAAVDAPASWLVTVAVSPGAGGLTCFLARWGALLSCPSTFLVALFTTSLTYGGNSTMIPIKTFAVPIDELKIENNTYIPSITCIDRHGLKL